MGTAHENLKAKLVALAASVADEVDQLEVLADIDDWYACRVAVAALQSTQISQYSLAGRTVTRRDIPSIESTERGLYARIHQKLFYRGIGLADLRTDAGGGA